MMLRLACWLIWRNLCADIVAEAELLKVEAASW
jgi:hypothetical protein